MKQLYRFLYFLNFIAFSSCEFTPNGENFKKISPEPKLEGISIELDNIQDTLYLRGDAQLNYTIKLPGNNIYGHRLMMDDKFISQLDTRFKGSYTFWSETFPNGYHELTLLINSSSNTGSIADRLGIEQLQVYRKWPVVIDNAPPSSVNIKSIKAIDGQLIVEWYPYSKRRLGFKRYILEKKNLQNNQTATITINDENITSIADPTYTGGLFSYRVLVEDDKTNRAGGSVTQINYPLATIKAFNFLNNSDDLEVKFSATKFYKVFDHYRLGNTFNFNTNITSYKDTVVTIRNIGFGSPFWLELSTIPKDFTFNPMGWGNSAVTFYGTKFYPSKPTSDALYIDYFNQETNTYYSYATWDTLMTMDGNSFKVTKRANYSTPPPVALNFHSEARSISPNGQFFYVAKKGEILQIDPTSLQVIKTVKMRDIIPKLSQNDFAISTSNNNRLTVFPYLDSVYVLDMNQLKVIFKTHATSIATPSKPSYPKISPDGQMIYTGNKLFLEQSANNWTVHQSFSPGFHCAFHPTEASVVIAKGTQLASFHTVTGDLLTNITAPVSLMQLQIDPVSGYLGGSTGAGYFHVFDLSSGQELKKVKLSYTHTSVKFLNRKLFSNEYYLNLGI